MQGETPTTGMIDCDIHPKASAENPIEPFVPEAIREALRQKLGGSPSNGYANPFGVDRRDAACVDPKLVAREHLDRYGITHAVMQSPGLQVSTLNNQDVGNAMAVAWNDWQHTWLDADERYLGSVCVNMNDPAAAAAEIRRVGRHPRVVQVLTSGEQRDLLGHRRYFPVYEAACEMGLCLTLHPGREGSFGHVTPVGRPSSYFEWHTVIPLTFQAHLVSLVTEGVFEQFKPLKVVLCEGGIFWAIHTCLRMDKNFKALRTAAPWLKKLPSEYVWDHVRFTTQPIEEPEKPSQLLALLEMVHAQKTVMFATDFPHWDFDNPDRVFPRTMDAALKRRIFFENAAETFGVGRRHEGTKARRHEGEHERADQYATASGSLPLGPSVP
ncbi:MAG: amidohydrolase family protein [Phycisphaerae bacterium]